MTGLTGPFRGEDATQVDEKGTQRECAFVVITHAYADQPANGRATCAANKDQCQDDWIVHTTSLASARQCLTLPCRKPRRARATVARCARSGREPTSREEPRARTP